MKDKARINPKTGVLYIPKALHEEGFKGDIDILANAKTATIVHPEANLKQVKKSLEIILDDIELRLEEKQEEE